MRNLILTFFSLLSFVGYSQKIKNKDGLILVDKVEYIKMKEDKVSRHCYSLTSLDDKDLFYIRSTSYNDPSTIRPTTPGNYSSGDVYYFEVLSADLNTIYFENRYSGSPFNSLYIENIIANLYNGEAINKDGTINEAKLELLSKKIGFEFSKKRDALSNKNSSNTVIIKEEPARRSGININLGR